MMFISGRDFREKLTTSDLERMKNDVDALKVYKAKSAVVFVVSSLWRQSSHTSQRKSYTMNINIFNDCKNESLFVDGQYLFQITFIDRSSSLLDSILAKYPTDRARLERVWDRLRAGQPTSDHVSLAYLMVPTVMPSWRQKLS